MAPNPVKGYDVVEDKNYKKDCKLYKSMLKHIINTELNIINFPEKNSNYHAPLHDKCTGLLHARVDHKLRILYKPDYKNKIIFLVNLLTHDEMKRKCH